MGTKVLIIGLDGATPELLERWVAEDRLPNLKKIMQKGVYGKLRSVYPPISPAAWTTFATGYNPGKHGVYDFRDYDNTRYSCFADTIVDSNSFAGKTIWDLTGAAGQKVGVVTVPMTYPAWRVNGFMISGYPTPDTGKNYTYPPELGKTIPPMVGDAAFFKSATHHVLLKEMNRLMHVSTDTSIAQMKKDDYGLFIMVVGATDRAHHDWWKYIDPEHPAYDSQEAKLYGNLILEVYRAADDCVGKFLEAIDDDTTVIVMSDHGGGAHPKYYFNTNCLLRTCDLLKASAKGGPKGAFKQFYRTKIRRFPYLERVYRGLPQGLKKIATNLDAQTMMNLDTIDWKQTKAYRFPMYPPVEGIMINVVGRQPAGCVQPGEEYEAIRTRILEEVRNLRDPKTGELIVLAAYRREELYKGERLEVAPDLRSEREAQDAEKLGQICRRVITVPLDRSRVVDARFLVESVLTGDSFLLGREARIIGALEGRACNRAQVVLAVSEQDRRALKMVAGESVPIAVVPITVDVQHFTSVLQARNPQPNRLFSIGTMFWLPSSEGVSWWLRNGYELLRARYPDLTYDIVGARPPHNLQALAAQHEGVTVHGYVADTLPFWTSATALAVPILSGGGVRVKILEAMAMGVPLVSTTVGCEGLNVRHGEHLLVADTPEAFAHAIARIFQDTALASQLARNARQFVLEHYDAKVALRTLDAAYEQARGLSERKPGKEYRP